MPTKKPTKSAAKKAPTTKAAAPKVKAAAATKKAAPVKATTKAKPEKTTAKPAARAAAKPAAKAAARSAKPEAHARSTTHESRAELHHERGHGGGYDNRGHAGSHAGLRASERSEPRRDEARESRPAGAHVTGPSEFVLTRKWSGKTVEPAVGSSVRVALPENALRGMAWQLQKLPHGVKLNDAEVEQVQTPNQGVTQNRVFNFSVEEEGEYMLQFQLARPFGQSAVADTFKIRLQARSEKH